MKFLNDILLMIERVSRHQRFVLISTLFLLVVSSCSKKQSENNEEHPNLVIFIADQWSAWDFGFLGAPVKTPNIDRFASQSLVLTNAISNANVCAPFRAMLMTGQYPITNGVLRNPSRPGIPGLRDTSITWSEVLNKNGYRLGYIGKWHLATPKKPLAKIKTNYIGRIHYSRTPPFNHKFVKGSINANAWAPPGQRAGFEFWYAYNTYDFHMHPMYWSTYVPKSGFFYVDEWEAKHNVDVAINFIKNEHGLYRDTDKPFGLVVSVNPPHMPYDFVPERYQIIYEDIPMDSLTQRPNIPPKDTKWGKYYRDKIKDYYAMMTGVDEQFGRLLDVLKKTGLKNNTIVLFLSDHGNSLGIHQYITKGHPYEEALRIPFFIRWPAHIPPGRDSLLISVPDIYPTLLDLMGFKSEIPPQVEGKSYATIFTGGQEERPDYQYYIMGNQRGLRTYRYTFVLTTGKRKGYVNSDYGKLYGMLFDRYRDPYQMHNLFNQRPKLVKRFKEKLKEVLKKRNDPWVRHLKSSDSD